MWRTEQEERGRRAESTQTRGARGLFITHQVITKISNEVFLHIETGVFVFPCGVGSVEEEVQTAGPLRRDIAEHLLECHPGFLTINSPASELHCVGRDEGWRI